LPVDNRVGQRRLEFAEVLVEFAGVKSHHPANVTVGVANELPAATAWILVQCLAKSSADAKQFIVAQNGAAGPLDAPNLRETTIYGVEVVAVLLE